MNSQPPESRRLQGQGWLTAAGIVCVIAALRAAADVLIPVTFALLLAVLLAPMVAVLKRWRIPSAISIPAVILVVLGGLGLLGGVLLSSLDTFIAAGPRYEERFREILSRGLAFLASHGVRTSIPILLSSLKADAVIGMAGRALTQVATMLSTLSLVLLLVAFMLFDAVDLRPRLERAFGFGAEGLDRLVHVGKEVKRYVVLKTYLCLLSGGLTWFVLTAAGVDFAPIWALTAFVLGYVPNVGPFIAFAPPVLLALLQYGPARMTLVLGALAAQQFVVGNVLEPQLLGRKLGLSALVVFLSLLAWGWVWGAAGMLLSVPLTQILKILLLQSDRWRWLAHLMESQPMDVPPSPPAPPAVLPPSK